MKSPFCALCKALQAKGKAADILPLLCATSFLPDVVAISETSDLRDEHGSPTISIFQVVAL